MFLLNYSRVRSVKTQLIYSQIASMTTCFDSQSHHEVNLEPRLFRYIKKQCTFWDPKTFTAVGERGHK